MTHHEQSTDWLKCPATRSVIGCSPCSCVGHADQECQKPQEEVCFLLWCCCCSEGLSLLLSLRSLFLYHGGMLGKWKSMVMTCSLWKKTLFKQKEVICMSYLCMLHIWWVYLHKAVSSVSLHNHSKWQRRRMSQAVHLKWTSCSFGEEIQTQNFNEVIIQTFSISE